MRDGEDTGFDENESAMLRNFFRDEAHAAFETLTRSLLAARDGQPSDDDIDNLLRTTHTLKGSAATVGLNRMSQLAHELEDRFDQLRSGKLEWSAAVADRLTEAIDGLGTVIDAETAGAPGADDAIEAWRARLADLGAEARRVERGARRADGNGRDEDHVIGEGTGLPGGATPRRAGPRGRDRRQERRIGDRRQTGRSADSSVLRVDSRRVDGLMNSAGELTFDRTRIERRSRELRRVHRDLAATRAALTDLVAERPTDLDVVRARLLELDAEVAKHSERLGAATSALGDDVDALRQTAEALQDGLTQVRMTTMESLFSRLARPVREMARSEGKRVELITSGAAVEFDTAVADSVVDPLMQLLRNAIAHGIEPEEVRVAAGKPAAGVVRMTARHEGESVWLDITDDGAGIDTGSLRSRYVDRGLWNDDQAKRASEDTVLRGLFLPGVSTRDRASGLAGRGVGLDSVRDTIARLGGDISVSTVLGKSTTFTLRLPVSTAVSQTLLFEVDGARYAVSNVHVIDTATVPAGDGQPPDRVTIDGEDLPLVDLHAVLDAPVPTATAELPAMVFDYTGRRFAVTCDRIVGAREAVVKTLGPLLEPLPLYAGGTISGAGDVQLILDSSALAREAFSDRASRRRTTDPSATPAMGRVLVADDSPTIRELVAHMLSHEGYAVETATDGRAAVEQLARARFDVLVTDIEMPRLNGFELVSHCRSTAALESLPIIVISSKTEHANRERAVELGASRFLPKPVTRRRLITALRELLR